MNNNKVKIFLIIKKVKIIMINNLYKIKLFRNNKMNLIS